MTLNPQYTNAVKQAEATAFLAALDAGTAAIITIYSGVQPTGADVALTGTLLATLTCSATAGVVSDAAPGALLTFSAITPDSSAAATGTATHFRILTQAGGTVIMDGSVGTVTTDLVLNSEVITAGVAVACSSFTILWPEGS